MSEAEDFECHECEHQLGTHGAVTCSFETFINNHKWKCGCSGFKRRKTKAKVIIFKTGGKFCFEEEWTVPKDAIGPFDMERSPDFRRIEGGAVLIESQEPWGYPHLFPFAYQEHECQHGTTCTYEVE